MSKKCQRRTDGGFTKQRSLWTFSFEESWGSPRVPVKILPPGFVTGGTEHTPAVHAWEWLGLTDCQLNVLTFKAASPHFSIAARPWLWMCVSRSFFNSPKPSWILDTRLYMRPKSERRRHHLYVLKQTLCNHSTKCAFIQIPWNKRTFFWTLVIRSI